MKNKHELLDRISEIDAHTWECEGSDAAVNAYLAAKGSDYLRNHTVNITRDAVNNTVTATVTSGIAGGAR